MRTFIIGDIHGCYDEFIELTKKIGLQDNDLLISPINEALKLLFLKAGRITSPLKICRKV